jgi:adenylate cyclase
VAYFTVARIYATATNKALETSALKASEERGGDLAAFLLLIRVGEADDAVSENTLKNICRQLRRSGVEAKSVEMLKGHQEGIWALFEQTLAVSWVVPAQDQTARERVGRDIKNLTASLDSILSRYVGPDGRGLSWFLHEGRVSGGKGARAGWRRLFAEAQCRWHETNIEDGGSER